MKPSIFTQLENCVQVGPARLMDSPRHWNPGLLHYKGKLWMCYRYHLKDASSRCATAICELNTKTFQPVGKSQHVPLECPTGTEHCEDARLFLFRGEPHISYTEMRGYKPGVDYECLMKYSRLRLRGTKWEVVETWQPIYGKNHSHGKEKNWVFFEHADAIHCIYCDTPNHVVIRLVGEHVTNVYESPAPTWYFGSIRGGTPPVRMADGNWMVIFHSSLPTELPPAYVRYYAGCYVFSSTHPFEVLSISTRAVASGSEADGHKVDPRYVQGWKPLVVFACGLVEETNGWLISFGINDWACGIARIREGMLLLGAADGADIKPRYFTSKNGSVPVLIMDNGRKSPLNWIVPRTQNTMVSAGYIVLTNPQQAEDVSEMPSVSEISVEEYERALMPLATYR